MAESFSIDRLRDILDKMGYRHTKRDGAIFATFNSDDFPKPMTGLFTAKNDKIQAGAWVEGLRFEGSRRFEGLEFCNEWNYSKANPCAYLDKDGDLRVKTTLFTDEPLTDEYVEENFVRLFLSTANQFYKEAAQKFL
ncbi:MAG: YbjN domain-containing protein [Thermoguttaceae bacterium]|nr:YbjN domain-containing protein [Thermoguttaceae bacterium]MBR4102924.1 YbjN domain-containing protein [Thermoguttaceae bacterium]